VKKYRGIYLKNAAEIGLMREANRIVAKILDAIEKEIRPGRPTMFFEQLAEKMCKEYGVVPAFKGYGGFPYILCVSVNEVIVHGFPSWAELEEGDIVSIDMGVIYDGFYGDAARTFTVGAVSDIATRLLTVTLESLAKGIEQAWPGRRLVDISRAVQEHVEASGLHVVRRFVGHGIGRKLHEKPEVPNFVTEGASEVVLKAGMTLAIEPMVTVGSPEVEIQADRWTAVTRDRSLAAHFEHSIAITPEGPEILSASAH
jgi:methionyl aminopeptidase